MVKKLKHKVLMYLKKNEIKASHYEIRSSDLQLQPFFLFPFPVLKFFHHLWNTTYFNHIFKKLPSLAFPSPQHTLG